ncbi:hypothetical protein LQ567_03695 [Niabella pedocola]|uniref:Uncharacterized protein n=1 Tax=Niabella pedocola TaxID=1752077 RepID=A0ABS8PL79_9BACT|nr:hypothetical protein [Niabella pedocola]MCD2421850.1 hypothetical protein [Niabella pedocola]
MNYQKWVVCFALLLYSSCLMAVELKTSATRVIINDKGFYTSVKVNEQELIAEGTYPLVSAVKNGQILLPKALKVNGNKFLLTMDDNQVIELLVNQQQQAITYEIRKISGDYKAVVFGPLKLSVHEVVGEVVGVVQDGNIAFAMQALNIKTNGGIPQEYATAYGALFNYAGRQTDLSVSSTPYYHFAAADTKEGAVFQLSARNRSMQEYRKVNQVENALVLPVNGVEGAIAGAKIAVFGDLRSRILDRIGKVETEQGLPHPLIEGAWGKVSRGAMRSYLITNFSEENIDFALEKTQLAGFKTIYHPDPFKTWGHFEWNPSLTKGGDAGMKSLAERASKKDIKIGVHTLSNFLTTNDAYVAPVPAKNLLKQGRLNLTGNIDDAQTAFDVVASDLFHVPLTLNALQIGNELITYGKAEKSGDRVTLTGCTRGAFGTQKAAHEKSEPLYKLWDYPYRTLFPDLELQDSFSHRLADIFNKTGLKQISFDGLEGCMYTGQDYYATARFVTEYYNRLQNKTDLINDASRLDHYLWHIHTRMNWGEPWGEEMRKGQVASRIKNQDYFRRNLFPRMLGWFLVRLAERNFEATSLEDLEWALSESAGFDAGYAMSINMKTLKNHGQINTLLEAMKNWDELRYANVFTEDQKNRLKDPETEWHLEKQSEKDFLLYPLFISDRFRCNLSEMQPGQPGGADWSWQSPEEGTYALRIKVEGDGIIANPSFTTSLGVIKIEGKLQANQYILLDHQGMATLTDQNYNVLSVLNVQGKALLPKGAAGVSFSCEVNGDSRPDVVVRYQTRRSPEKISVP